MSHTAIKHKENRVSKKISREEFLQVGDIKQTIEFPVY